MCSTSAYGGSAYGGSASGGPASAARATLRRTVRRFSRGREAVRTVRTQVAHADPWTTEALYALPEDGMRHELLDGTLLVSPPPSVPHQLAACRLVAALGAAAPAGLLVPDVVVARAAAVHGALRNLAAADVLAVVEIVSPSSRTQDRRWKPEAYAEAGIGAFVRVELTDTADGEPEITVSDLDPRVVA